MEAVHNGRRRRPRRNGSTGSRVDGEARKLHFLPHKPAPGLLNSVSVLCPPSAISRACFLFIWVFFFFFLILREMGSAALGDCDVLRGFYDSPGLGAGASATLVLDGERGELVRAPARAGKNGKVEVLDARVAMALKSHTEAERRRRQRINGHLTTLRSMVPCTEKLDKAALLAEVINHVKRLKRDAMEISKCCTIPSEVDEVRVEGDLMNNGSFIIRASISCDERPDLLADIRQTLQTLQLKTIRAEISTMGGRVKNVLVMTYEGNANGIEKHLYTSSVHHALKSTLDRVNSSLDLLPKTSFPNKRCKIPPYASSSSS